MDSEWIMQLVVATANNKRKGWVQGEVVSQKRELSGRRPPVVPADCEVVRLPLDHPGLQKADFLTQSYQLGRTGDGALTLVAQKRGKA
jgi:hypothetical protein